MAAGGDDSGRRILVVAIVGVGLLAGAGVLFALMYSFAEGAREAIARKGTQETGTRSDGTAAAAAPGDFDAEILAATDARIAALPDAARTRIADLRAAAPADVVARFVDSATRLEMAARCVRAHFGGTPPGADGDDVAPGAFAAPGLAAARERLGRMLALSPHGGRSGTSDVPPAGAGPVRATSTFRAWFEHGFAEVETRFTYAGRAAWRIESVTVTETEPGPDEARPDDGTTVPPDARATSADGIVRQTCDDCGAVRFGLPGEAWKFAGLRADAGAGHVHLWKDGASNGLRDTVANGTVVLVKRGASLAAVTLRRQTQEPERVSFDWAFRDDGGTVLDPADPAVATGTVEDAKRIDFHGIGIDWSIAGDGSGWLYYSRSVGVPAHPDDVRLCVTDLRDLVGLDAADARWVFRASLSDEGVPAK